MKMIIENVYFISEIILSKFLCINECILIRIVVDKGFSGMFFYSVIFICYKNIFLKIFENIEIVLVNIYLY